MRIDGNTTLSSLTHNDDELCHWKYIKRERGLNGKYRYWYADADPEKIDAASKKFAKAVDSTKKTLKKIDSKLNKLDRYIEAGKVWYESWLGLTIVDSFKGQKGKTWQEAKEWVDYTYRYGDKKKFLTDKYK